MRENKRFLFIFLIIVIFFGMTFYHVFEFSKGSKNLIENQTYVTLGEHAETAGKNLQIRLEEQFILLEALADYFSKREELSLKEEIDLNQFIMLHSNFVEVGIAHGETGIVNFEEGENVDISDQKFFKDSMQGNRSVGYLKEEREESGYLILSTPVFHREKVISVLIAKVNPDLVTSCLEPVLFEGSIQFCVTDNQGNILNFGQKDNWSAEDNLLTIDSRKKGKPEEIFDITDNSLINSFSNRNKVEDTRRLITYIPLEINDWYIFSSVPDDALVQLADEFKSLGTKIIIKMFFISCLMVILVYLLAQKVGKKIKKEHERSQLAEEIAGMVCFEGDYKKDTVVVNGNYYKQFGRKFFLQKLSDFQNPHPFIMKEDQEAFLEMGKELLAGKETGSVEYRYLCKNGNVQWQQFKFRVFYDKLCAPIKCYGMIIPIDQQMKEISKLQVQIEKDPMTGVLNRMAFEINVNLCFKEDLEKDSHALLLLDLDNFKRINDGFGHALGDKALITTAEILKSCVRNSDFVGRLGGDEFAVFLKNVNEEQAAHKAGEICEALEKAEIKSDEAIITCSIGIACYPKDGCGFDELYELADQGLYKVKGTGKNNYALI